MEEVPLSKAPVNPEIEQAALRAIRSGQYVLAQACRAFEVEVAAYVGAEHAVLGSSCTLLTYLLHIAQRLGAGDEVIVPAHTAFPTIEPLIHCGATPVFVDIDDTYCLDVDEIARSVTSRTVGIIPVHLYGHPADLERVLAVADAHDLWVLEDCAQSLGARFRGRPVGSFGDAGVFSFYPSKNLTVLGDGGCLVTDDARLTERIRMLRNHGRKHKYLHELCGFNIRFNEIQAAVGRVMLKHLEGFNQTRRRIAAHYTERLAGVVQTPPKRAWAEPVYHLYVIRTPHRDALQTFLEARKIRTGIHYPVPTHLQPAITRRFPNGPRLPKTERAAGEILSLPLHGEMSLDVADRVCDAIEEFFQARAPTATPSSRDAAPGVASTGRSSTTASSAKSEAT